MKQEALHLTCKSSTEDNDNLGTRTKMKSGRCNVQKIVLKPGSQASEHPRDGAICTVDIVKVPGSIDPISVESKIHRVTFPLGEGPEHGIPRTVEQALRKFRSGERSRLEIRTSKVRLYPEEDPTGGPEDKVGEKIAGINECTENTADSADCSEYVLELVEFKQTPGHWELSPEESLAYAVSLKNRGTDLFKAAKYRLSKRCYKRALLYLQLASENNKQELETSTFVASKSQNDDTTTQSSKLFAQSDADADGSKSLQSTYSSTDSNKADNNSATDTSADSTVMPTDSSQRETSSSSATILPIKENVDFNSKSQSLKTKTSTAVGKWDFWLKGVDIKGVTRRDMVLACNLNIALCYLKLGKNLSALEACEKVLELDPTNEKGLYRRGLAHMAVENLDLAVEDFKSILSRQPKNRAACQQLAEAKKRLKDFQSKQKCIYTGMFTRFAQHDILKQKEAENSSADVFSVVGEWNNDLASGMMTLEQEMEAFGEVPENRPPSTTEADSDVEDNASDCE